MKYLFIITGIAYGHLTREEAIINHIKKLDKNAEIIIAGYRTSYNYFKKDHKIIKLNEMVFSEDSSSHKITRTILKNYDLWLTWIKNYRIIKEFSKENKPDIIISDWEPFALFLSNCYLIWNYKPEYSKKISMSLLFQKLLLGSQYLLLKILNKKLLIPSLDKKKNTRNFLYFPLIIRKSPNQVKSSKYKNTILVMIGGSKFGSSLARKIKNISKNFDEKFIFFGMKCKSKNCIGFKEFRKDYLSFLKSSKAVISLAGYSGISETLAYKKPNLVFPIKNHVEQNSVAEEFKNYIQIENIESSEEDLKGILKSFLLNLDKYKKKLNKLKIKDGAKEVAEFIYKKVKS